MNRRELLAGLGTLAATCGGTVSAIEAEPKPILLVLTVPHALSCKQIENIRTNWNARFKGVEGVPPMLILEGGATLEAVLDPRHNNAERP